MNKKWIIRCEIPSGYTYMGTCANFKSINVKNIFREHGWLPSIHSAYKFDNMVVAFYLLYVLRNIWSEFNYRLTIMPYEEQKMDY